MTAARPILILALICFSAHAIAGDSNHWAFQKIARPPLPEAAAPNSYQNPVDRFIAARLAKDGLEISGPAEARALVRRLYFNLTGLPPSAAQVREFEQGKISYDALVERLLSSPQYGERWARHWLDVVRFAETHGFEMNNPRPNAWPFRDYVIRAFNEDKPYDQFVREQLAGDVFGVDAATGFLVGGPWDQVKSPDPVLTSNQRADELHDIVSTVGSTFLGLTVGCARCHNHKFDPVPQVDYFAIRAVFEGVQHGERMLRTQRNEVREKELAQVRSRLGDIERRLEELEPWAAPTTSSPARAAVNARRNLEKIPSTPATHLRFTIFKTTDAEPCIDELEVYTAGGTNIALASAGTKAKASGVYPNSELHRLEHLNDGRHGNSRSWISNEPGQGWVELEFAATHRIEKIVWGRDREERFKDRLPLDYRIELREKDGPWRLVAASADRQPYSATSSETAPDAASPETKSLAAERTQLRKRSSELAKADSVYAGTFKSEPEVTYRLHRGDPMLKREPVEPGPVGIIPVAFQTNSPSRLNDDQKRRLALAKWITHLENPLTARVMVNRIWQYHFGEGLVSTPSDFGANGARPAHPELLDWLSAEFISSGWSIKNLQRLIVTSAVFRQSSRTREEGMRIDAESRLLWRFPPRRLEAEAIRDSILATAGKLDLRMGGPGFSFFEPNENYVRVYSPRAEWTDETFRRMIYGTVVRQRPDGVFGVFDCPDAGQIAPKRTSSTTPLQALNLLNSTFILSQAEHFAGRLEAECPGAPEERVQRAFELAFQRAPSPEELAAGIGLAREHGLKALCRALFNANEFVYLF